jgi:hypothetical protein
VPKFTQVQRLKEAVGGKAANPPRRLLQSQKEINLSESGFMAASSLTLHLFTCNEAQGKALLNEA